MATELNFWQRLQGETPKFFKRVIRVAITLAAAATAVLYAPATIPEFTLSPTVVEICHYVIVAGIVAGVIAKSTVTDNQAEKTTQ